MEMGGSQNPPTQKVEQQSVPVVQAPLTGWQVVAGGAQLPRPRSCCCSRRRCRRRRRRWRCRGSCTRAWWDRRRRGSTACRRCRRRPRRSRSPAPKPQRGGSCGLVAVRRCSSRSPGPSCRSRRSGGSRGWPGRSGTGRRCRCSSSSRRSRCSLALDFAERGAADAAVTTERAAVERLGAGDAVGDADVGALPGARHPGHRLTAAAAAVGVGRAGDAGGLALTGRRRRPSADASRRCRRAPPVAERAAVGAGAARPC